MQNAAFARVAGGNQNPRIHGTVSFYQRPEGTLVVAQIYGLPAKGFFGFHIHAGQQCTGQAFADTGSHYNPGNGDHPDHAGDLPPLLSVGGKAYMAVLTGRFRVTEVIGKTVVIHSKPDDFISQPAGNAGEKIACGKIERG